MLLDLRSLLESSATTYAYVGSGGIVFAGAATEKFAFTYAASGGIVFSGPSAFNIKFVRKYTVNTGEGIVFGGTLTEKFIRVYVVSGGVVFGGAATVVFAPAAAFNTYVYAGSGGIVFGGTATTSGPAVVEDSRGWSQLRGHAHVSVDAFPIIARWQPSRPTVTASAAVGARGLAISRAVGRVSVSADVSLSSTSNVRGLSRHVSIGSVRVSSSARGPVSLSAVRVALAHSLSAANARVVLSGISTRAVTGRVNVVIGPDLVQQDDEELLFLLEVA